MFVLDPQALSQHSSRACMAFHAEHEMRYRHAKNRSTGRCLDCRHEIDFLIDGRGLVLLRRPRRESRRASTN